MSNGYDDQFPDWVDSNFEMLSEQFIQKFEDEWEEFINEQYELAMQGGDDTQYEAMKEARLGL